VIRFKKFTEFFVAKQETLYSISSSSSSWIRPYEAFSVLLKSMLIPHINCGRPIFHLSTEFLFTDLNYLLIIFYVALVTSKLIIKNYISTSEKGYVC
jgi:hypothetical protein